MLSDYGYSREELIDKTLLLLGDPDGDKYTRARVALALNEACLDFVLEAALIHETINIRLAAGTGTLSPVVDRDDITRTGGPDGTLDNLIFADDVPALWIPGTMTDADCPADWVDTEPIIQDYTGDEDLTATYTTPVINAGSAQFYTLILEEAHDMTLGPGVAVSLSYKLDGGAWVAYTASVEATFTTVQVKAAITALTTDRFKMTKLRTYVGIQ